MTWEKQHLTQVMESVALAGSTLRVYSARHDLEAVAGLDLSSNRLILSMRVGDYVYQSDWWEMSPLLERVGMAQLLREGLERWLLLATQPYSRQTPTWTPMELTTQLIRQIEHLLA